MAHVSCPCCEEIVRLPVDHLPKDASVRCPWCSATLPAADWLINLPPVAIILGADGQPLESPVMVAPVQPDQDTQPGMVKTGPMALDSDVVSTDGVGLGAEASAFGSRETTFAPSLTPLTVETAEAQDAADTIDLDEPLSSQSTASDSTAEPSGTSIVSFDVDEFSNELSLAQPSIDEIENAWDATEGWESHESTVAAIDSDDDIDTSMNHTLEIQKGQYSESAANFIDDVPVGVTGARKDDHRAEFQRHQWARKRRKVTRLLKIASPTLLAIPIIGGILIYSGADLGFYPFDGPSNAVMADASQSSADQNGLKKTEARAPGEHDIDAANDTAANDTAANEATSRWMDNLDPSFDHDSGSVTIDEVIQSLDGRGQEFADDLATDPNKKPSVTIEMIARRQRAERSGEKETVVTQDAPAEDRELLLFAFPRQPPSADAVRQANAEVRHSVAPMESPEMIAACERAIDSVRKLGLNKPGETPSNKTLKTKLLAFRDISRVGSLTTDVDNPCIDEMLSELASSSVLDDLIPLCSEWIAWRGRKTDGMLLIGQLQDQDGETYVELSDGSRVDVQLDENRKMPVESQCVMLCKIVPGNEPPRVQLVVGTLVP